MCGLERDPLDYRYFQIGSDMLHVKVYDEKGKFVQEFAQDELIDSTFWGSIAYKRKLTENDINASKVSYPTSIVESVQRLLEDRKA
jgi:hypothetical protein